MEEEKPNQKEHIVLRDERTLSLVPPDLPVSKQEEHIAVLERYEGREVPWTKEINNVSWNGGQPKFDLRDWSEDHTRMSQM